MAFPPGSASGAGPDPFPPFGSVQGSVVEAGAQAVAYPGGGGDEQGPEQPDPFYQHAEDQAQGRAGDLAGVPGPHVLPEGLQVLSPVHGLIPLPAALIQPAPAPF